MPNSSRMTWPYPSENQDPWFEAFKDFINAADVSAYAAREDRTLILAKGGTFLFDSISGALSWNATLEVMSPISGFRMDLLAGSVVLQDGQIFYVNLTRYPVSNVILTAQVGDQLPSNDVAYPIAVRRGTSVYFRHGLELPTSTPMGLFDGGGGGGGGGGFGLANLWLGGRETHNSDTPLIVSAVAFTPVSYTGLVSLVFRAVAANGTTGLTNHVQLYNVTDSQLVAELDFTSTSAVKDEVALTLGVGVGEIDTPEHIYEVRILLGAPSGGVSDTIELYSAELRVL